jgi:hypothetical protein
MKRFFSVVGMALLLTIVAAAQAGLTGKWEGETGAGAPIVLDLTVKGKVLTGTLTRSGLSSPLSEGKVTKSTFTFKATLNGQIEGFSGELTGDRINVWLDRQGSTRAVVLKRAKRA